MDTFEYDDDASFCSEDSFFADGGGYETKICPATDLDAALASAAGGIGKLDQVKLLVDAGADINCVRGYCRCPPLSLAVREKNIELVKWLVEQPGLDVNQKDCGGSTPLKKARIGNMQGIAEILEKCYAKDNTSISEATNIKMIDRFIEEGADINTPNSNGDTLLHKACNSYRDDHFQTNYIIQLLDRGADVHARNWNGKTPLHLAAYGSTRVNAVRTLLERGGADIEAVDDRGRTPFLNSYAPDIMSLLLQKGANVNARNKNGSNQLHELCSQSEPSPGYHDACLNLLFRNGIDVNAKGYGGKTPLMVAGSFLEQFLKEGADPTITNDKGWNTLHIASDRGEVQRIDLLLQHNTNYVDANRPTENGASALHLALWSTWNWGDTKTVKRLLEHGADANAKARNGSTPLGGAIGRYADLDAVKILLDHGADVNGLTTRPQEEPDFDDYERRRYDSDDSDEEEEDEGSDKSRDKDEDELGKKQTPLLMAIKGKHEKIALLLLDYNADPSHTNEKQESPLILATTLGLTSVVNRLLKMGVGDGSWNPN